MDSRNKRFITVIFLLFALPTVVWAASAGRTSDNFSSVTMPYYQSPGVQAAKDMYGIEGSSASSWIASADALLSTLGAGSGDFLSTGTVPMTGTIQMDGNDFAEATTRAGTAYIGTTDTTSIVISGDTITDFAGTGLSVSAGVLVVGTAPLASTLTVADNESTNETNAVVFLPGGDLDGGNLALESDGTFNYNPSTGTVTATAFAGGVTGEVTGNASTATALAADPANCSAGSYATGITAAGVAEGCTDAGGAVANAFKTIIVAGQDSIVADSSTDSLTIAAGSNISITTQAGQDTATISATLGTISAIAGTNMSVSGATVSMVAVLADAYVADTITIELATLATTLTITDNEATDETNAVVFTEAGDVDGGNLGLESDGTFNYNPSTGTVTAIAFVGDLTGDVTGTADALAANPINCSAGSYARGIAADGSAENCTDAAQAGTISATAGTNITVVGSSVSMQAVLADAYVADTITIDLADTATALAADPANCSAGNSPLGITAAGAAEDCFDVQTGAEASSHAGSASVHHTATTDTNLTAGGGLSIASSVITLDALTGGWAVAGTSFLTTAGTYPVAARSTAITITSVRCITDTGTVIIDLQEGTSTSYSGGTDITTSPITCDSNSQTASTVSNATIDANDWMAVAISTDSGSPTTLGVTWYYTVD